MLAHCHLGSSQSFTMSTLHIATMNNVKIVCSICDDVIVGKLHVVEQTKTLIHIQNKLSRRIFDNFHNSHKFYLQFLKNSGLGGISSVFGVGGSRKWAWG